MKMHYFQRADGLPGWYQINKKEERVANQYRHLVSAVGLDCYRIIG